MKKLQCLFIILLCASFFSCKQEEVVKPIHLDVAKLKEMKTKWQSLDIKNYSFTYVFNVWKPDLHTGYVKVENGIGKVIFKIEGSYEAPDPDDEWDKRYYITSIDKVFDNILDMYLWDKKRWENGKLDYFDYGNFSNGVKYHPSYFFPEKMRVSHEKPGSGMMGGGHISLTIKDFKVLE